MRGSIHMLTLSYYSKPLEESMALRDIRILVAIDFGTTFSGFAPGRQGNPKTPTAILYDKEYTNVICWGYSALEEEPDEELDDPEERPPIVDYLTQMRKLIKETLEKRWPTIKFPQQVDLVFTIPAEIMRECAYNAGLLTSIASNNIDFTTEHSFFVADCGGGTVDLTSRKLLPENKLSEITERIGDLCGSTFVDKEFYHGLVEK
ncbi:4881_t:CDS:2 [Funneliformis mosseae]|uniref:4881_t:CDS:1 n=1 Tax=Funneliformis mosseae TaxID=27381 RepID=A0A9N9EMX3_FUNMO|nr:4881_t:CDS:2 [Funneliformis mosseae]